MPEDFHTWPAKKDIQQSAAKSLECWTDCYLDTAGVSPCPIFPWLVQPARAGSAGQFLLRLYIKCQRTSTPGRPGRTCSRVQRNQSSAGMAVMFFCVFIVMVVPDRSATGWVQAKSGRKICLLWQAEPVGCCLVGAAGWVLSGWCSRWTPRQVG